MQQVLVYSDSLSWGIIPLTRDRFAFHQRWPGIAELALNARRLSVRIIEDCLNGRRTVWDDPFRPGRNGQQGLAQRIEVHSPLALVVLMLGTNDFQSMHQYTVWHSAQGIACLVNTIRQAPLEPGMPIPPILVIAPPPLGTPKGPIAPKFEDAEIKSAGLAKAYLEMCEELGCDFFDAGRVTASSAVDGVHLDLDQHLALGLAVADKIAEILTRHGAAINSNLKLS